jgi:hypothetical protein
MRRIALFVAGVAIVAGCSESTAPTKPTDQLNFLRLAPTAPAYLNASDSFWAVKGSSRSIRIYFVDSTPMMRFSVPSSALLQWPNGTPFAVGDSVLIHVTVIDPVHMIVQFEPSGLVFSASDPAHIRFYIAEADDDVNDDGQVNAADTTATLMLHLWRQESAGLPWMELTTIVNIDDDEVDADILGFTNYALAF